MDATTPMPTTPARRTPAFITVMMTLLMTYVINPARLLAVRMAPATAVAPWGLAEPNPSVGARRSLRAALTDESGQSSQKAAVDTMIGIILLAFTIVIGLQFYPMVTSAVADAKADPNSSADDVRNLVLIPTIFILAILLVAIAFLFRGFREFRDGSS